jgi:uncharacterized UBP type Zn finger protein
MNPEHIANLTSMGFSKNAATNALKKHKGDIEMAAAYLF